VRGQRRERRRVGDERARALVARQREQRLEADAQQVRVAVRIDVAEQEGLLLRGQRREGAGARREEPAALVAQQRDHRGGAFGQDEILVAVAIDVAEHRVAGRSRAEQLRRGHVREAERAVVAQQPRRDAHHQVRVPIAVDVAGSEVNVGARERRAAHEGAVPLVTSRDG
jgi:hypothetical protein